MNFILPFKEEWFTFWGGETVEQNYHYEVENAGASSQKYAFDFFITKGGKSHPNARDPKENHYCFDKEIISITDGEVVQTVDGVIDIEPGYRDGYFGAGNMVIIKHDVSVFSAYLHLKRHSIKVKEGQIVKQGEIIAHCGNTGRTTQPHLHFQLQNEPNPLFAEGIPCRFSKIKVNGEIKENYMPLKGDFVSNII